MHLGISALVKTFVSPQTSLGDLDAAAAATLIGASSDITLVLDSAGVIQDTAFQSGPLLDDLPGSVGWVGQPLTATVAPDSRVKIIALLQDAHAHAEPRWRHLNHLAADGSSIPVMYCGVQVGEDGRVVAFGRDLRAMSALQQRLMNAQQGMERDYARLRDVEMRYRLLFQMSSEAVLILDPAKGRITEANPAAKDLCNPGGGAGTADVTGKPLSDLFGPGCLPAIQAQVDAIRSGGRAEDVAARLLPDNRSVTLRMSLFRQENAALVLLRMVPVAAATAGHRNVPDPKMTLLRTVESAPDAYVVTDEDGDIITANAAFLELVQMMHEDEVVGQRLDRWVGESGVDLSVLTANLRSRGAVRFFSTTVHGEHGAMAQVEMSAVSVPGEGQTALGYAIRNVSSRLNIGVQVSPLQAGAATRAGRALPRSVEQLTELIGRVSLKDLVRESTEVIERLAIEAALELTGDNRASAAEMLGLSRQSLYVKLRRYGIGDLTAADTE